MVLPRLPKAPPEGAVLKPKVRGKGPGIFILKASIGSRTRGKGRVEKGTAEPTIHFVSLVEGNSRGGGISAMRLPRGECSIRGSGTFAVAIVSAQCT